MNPFQFYYNHQWYKGTYVISGAANHGFFWCFLDAEELTRSFGQCMIFSFSNGTLMPAKAYDAAHQELVDAIRSAILPLYRPEDRSVADSP